jgi:ABC-type uncharacterized transport system involved in gliding motility auxiliary subunit
MKITNILTLTHKELKNYFDTPTAYIVLVVFLLLWEFLFFKNAFVVGEANLRGLFDILPWLLLFVVPAVTMGAICQEKNEGTLEWLLSTPINSIEMILGKCIAAFLFVCFALLFTIPIAISFSWYGPLDWGVFIGQLLSSLCTVLFLVSLGIWISSTLSSVITTLLVTALVIFIFILIGTPFFSSSFPLFFAPLMEQLSLITHFDSMARGVIDTRDIWYFLSFTIIFISLGYLKLLKFKFGNNKKKYQSFQIGIALFIGIALLTNVIGSWIPGRVDLTQGKIYSLSEATKTTLANLKDLVNITLYASHELPVQVQPVLRETKDILKDYQTYGKGNIIVQEKDPTKEDIATEAKSLGVIEIQFNVMGQSELQVKKGYLGIVISYANDHEVIPYIQDTSDLEYQLTSFIKKLTTTTKKNIVFLSGHGEKSTTTDYKTLAKELSKQFEVQTFTKTDKDTSFPAQTAVVVIAGPQQPVDDATKKMITDYIDQGGSVLFLLHTVSIPQQGLFATENKNSLNDLTKSYGVDVQTNIVYDVRSNEIIQFGGGMTYFFTNYPFWPRVPVKDTSSVIVHNLQSIVLPWGSSIKIDQNTLEQQKLNAKILFATTKAGGVQEPPFNLAPDQTFSTSHLGEQIVAVALTPQDGKHGRMVVVGNSSFLNDDVVSRNPENIAFAVNAISYLAQEDSLASIQLKQKTAHKLSFEHDYQQSMIQYGNLAFAVLLPLIIAAIRFGRRKIMRSKIYTY